MDDTQQYKKIKESLLLMNFLQSKERYQKSEKIGKATYGLVYMAKNNQTGEIVVLKKIRLDHKDEVVPLTSIREISLLKEVQIQILFFQKMQFMMNQELYLSLSLWIQIQKSAWKMQLSQLDKVQVKKFIHQILQALNNCHQNRVILRDLKPQNILIDLKQAFSIYHEVITLWYKASEIYWDRNNTQLLQWIYGLLVVYLLTWLRNDHYFLFKIFKMMGITKKSTWTGVSIQEQFPGWPTHNKSCCFFVKGYYKFMSIRIRSTCQDDCL
ncbi:unnamed protein product (macronuclear) [Paramecium tetraurelia]|uniref:Cyclin-dependent kinase 2 homolog n=1 Tax=Paramecium tetraurelia TaxID=5888 RepID=A0CVW4_PARTE|nr:uncharacterized protein GSPATT00001133001 [Paramecium tetraurelia]CAK74931.1 unnamed protein product [Paramecium tetraurelia]|eukprot:XP_001442328.1 hypothetical protein (macronuclear) [Paramecium tetraurelia strain d4-2]